MTKKLDLEYKVIQQEVIDKINEAKKLLKEANDLVPSAKFKYDNYPYAEVIADIEWREHLGLLTLINDLGWNTSSMRC